DVGSIANGWTLTLTTPKRPTSTSLTSAPNPSNQFAAATFTATVTDTSGFTGTPGGTVTFKEGPTTLGTGTLNGSGQATFTTTALGLGPHSVTAEYAGDSTYLGSTSAPVIHTVDAAVTLDVNDVSVTEGNSGTVNAVFTVTLTGNNHSPVSVDF